MTLDEAIQHCEEVAKEQERLCKCNDDFNFSQPKWKKCAGEHRQLASWLRQLKSVKDIIQQHDNDRLPEDYFYIDKIREVLK